jgi:hypothetical protein
MNHRSGFSIIQVLVAAGLAAVVMSVLASATNQSLKAQRNVEIKGTFEGDIQGMRQLLADSNNCKKVLDLLEGQPVTGGASFPIPYGNQKYGMTATASGPIAFSALRPGSDYTLEKLELSIGAFNTPASGAFATALGSLEVSAQKKGSIQMGGSTMHRSIPLAVAADNSSMGKACVAR